MGDCHRLSDVPLQRPVPESACVFPSVFATRPRCSANSSRGCGRSARAAGCGCSSPRRRPFGRSPSRPSWWSARCHRGAPGWGGGVGPVQRDDRGGQHHRRPDRCPPALDATLVTSALAISIYALPLALMAVPTLAWVIAVGQGSLVSDLPYRIRSGRGPCIMRFRERCFPESAPGTGSGRRFSCRSGTQSPAQWQMRSGTSRP